MMAHNNEQADAAHQLQATSFKAAVKKSMGALAVVVAAQFLSLPSNIKPETRPEGADSLAKNLSHPNMEEKRHRV
ncbi:hypothetical protein OCU04_010753 [Sclerotinia nivalis]|uniref:Uncharacterized protein n=1 Tax=Sclerotinia nivalis TaxID=352851 RepID=A0A9X0ACQ0_9HELO|nr:hypothetical protein OCU04_010753 [Sclerotinia nivalis]